MFMYKINASGIKISEIIKRKGALITNDRFTRNEWKNTKELNRNTGKWRAKII